MADQSVLLDKVRLTSKNLAGTSLTPRSSITRTPSWSFPQSGERFDGRATFTEWRSQYPAKVGYRLQRVTVRDDLAVVELTAQYDDGPTRYGVAVLEFRDDKIAKERIYVMDGWDAPEWRARWRSDKPPSPE